MPTVPEIFAPSVSQGDMPMTPAGGPWVAPMRNSAPGLLQQTGQTLDQAGATETRIGDTIKDRVQDTLDSSMAQAAQNKFLQSAYPALEQYKTTEGMNATTQFQPTADAISKARQDARVTLVNPMQQRMFDIGSNDHMLSFQQQMAQHEGTQRIQYGKQTNSDSADSMNIAARMAYLNGDMAGYQDNSQRADQYTLQVATLSGAAPGSPMADAMLRAKRGDLAHSVISGLLERHAVDEADQYFQNVQGSIDMHSAELLDSAIKTAHMQENPKIDVERAGMAASGIKGPGVLQPPIPAGTISTVPGADGVDIFAAKGTKVLAPGSGTVTKVWSSPEQGFSAQIALPNGYTATFSGLGAVNYEAGQKITVGQALGLSGAGDNGRAATHYAMTGPDGKSIDPRQASSAPLDPRNLSTPDAEEKGVDWLNNNVADPDERELAVRLWRSTVNGNREILNQEHAEAVRQATDYYLQHGRSLNGAPQSITMPLTPEDLDSFSQDKTARAKNDPQTEINFLSGATPLTADNVKAAYAQGKLSDGGYVLYMTKALKVQNDPQKTRQVSIDHDQLTDIFAANQMSNLAEPKNDGDRTQRVEMETAIKNEIDIQQQRSNRALSWQEKGKIARDMVTDKVYTTSPWYSSQVSQGLMPVALATPEQLKNATVWVGGQSVRMMDIPPQVVQRATQEIQTTAPGVQPTQANIAAWWLRSGKPTQ